MKWSLSRFFLCATVAAVIPACGGGGGGSGGASPPSGPPAGASGWTKGFGNPALTLGTTGSWDEFAVHAPSVLKVGPTYIMYYYGFPGLGIGLATSPDGTTWTKSANTVLSPGAVGSWDEMVVDSPSVFLDGGIYRMWYEGLDQSGSSAIGLAISFDGINWTKSVSNPVLTSGSAGTWDAVGIRTPTVILDTGVYKMWYMGIDIANTERVGYATSPDGIVWTKHASNPVIDVGAVGAFDESRVGFPSVLLDGSVYRMWYDGSGPGLSSSIGYADSIDGITWVKFSGNPVLTVGPVGSWEELDMGDPTVIKDGSTFKMWYTGWPQGAAGSQIGYATNP